MALVQSLAKRKGQIKSRERVRDLAEVYTHEREVDAMLDLVPDMFPSGATRATPTAPSSSPPAAMATSWRRFCAASSRS